MAISPDTALILFSGGQDSTVCLAWALERFSQVETVGFAYGQRHAVELEARPRRFVIHTPLMWIDKAATFAIAAEIGGKALLKLVVEETHSCYLGDRTPHSWGRGCGACPACSLRAAGYEKFVTSRQRQ